MTEAELSNLNIDFVSLVPQGADQDADIILAKTADSADPKTVLEEGAMPTDEKTTTELPEDLSKAIGDLGIELNDKQTTAFNEAVGAALVAAVAEKPELTDDEITAKGWVRVEVSDDDGETSTEDPVTKATVA